MSKHTPGPWYVATDVDGGLCIEADRGTHRDEIVVARWEGGSSCAIGMADADARLIAAAPDLLEVAKEVREQCLFGDDDGIGVSEDVVIPSDLFDRLCVAINKAEGRQ